MVMYVEDMQKIQETRLFKNEALLNYGFVKEENRFVYVKPLPQTDFSVRISVGFGNTFQADVLDRETGDSYDLVKSPAAEGEYIGNIRKMFMEIVEEVVNVCSIPQVFKSIYAQQVIHYVRDKYNRDLEFLWKTFPQNAVVRRQDNDKWFAVLLTVRKNRLGLTGDDLIEVIDLRAQPEDVQRLVDGRKYFPAYHMNKKHWLTICLDGTVFADEIARRIDESYRLAK